MTLHQSRLYTNFSFSEFSSVSQLFLWRHLTWGMRPQFTDMPESLGWWVHNSLRDGPT